VLQLQLSVVTSSVIPGNRTSTAAPGLHRSQSLPAPPSSSGNSMKHNRSGTAVSRADDGGDGGAIDLTANSTDDDESLRRSTEAPGKALTKRTRTATHPVDRSNKQGAEHECVNLVDTGSDTDSLVPTHSKPDRKQQAVPRTGTRRSRTVVSGSSDEETLPPRSANVENAIDADVGNEVLNTNSKRRRGMGVRQVIRGSSDGALNTTATAVKNGGTDPVSAVISAEPLVPFPQQRTSRVTAAADVVDSRPAGRGLGRRDSSYSSLRSVSKLLGAKLGKPTCAQL
jgi:hypothetical protein